MDAIAINKLYMLNFMYCTMYLAMLAAGLSQHVVGKIWCVSKV